MSESAKYGNASDFDIDLHSIYAAYLGLFEATNTDWWDKSWGGYFATFNDFLLFGWEAMVVVDSITGKPHIAVRREQIALLARMIRTRYGDSLPKEPPTTLPLNPVPTRSLALRRLHTVRDLKAYKKLVSTLQVAELSYLRSRVRAGEPEVIEQLFYAGGSSGERDTGGAGVRDNGVGYTFACIKTNWWEKGGPPYGVVPGQGRTQPGKPGQGSGKGLVLELGTAVLRCPNLRAVGVWPPIPAENYRKSHYVVEEWVDKRTNQGSPSYPRAYAFGKSEFVAERRIETILDATLNGLASHDGDTQANTLILLSVGEPVPLPLPPSSTLPSNVLQIDVLALEFNLLRRAQSQGIPNTPDRQGSLTSLSQLLQTLQIPVAATAPLGNAGNDAYYTLLAFQKLVMGETRLPDMLFSQPSSPYPNMPFPAANRNSMVFPPYQAPAIAIPIPVMPAAGRSRYSSGSPSRLSEYRYPSVPLSSDRSDGRRYSSEISRRRPASVGDPLSVITSANIYPGKDGASRGSFSGYSAERPKRQSVLRSNTVFWDDAAYAQDGGSARDMGDLALKAPLRSDLTGNSSGSSHSNPRGRSRDGPPLSRSAAINARLGNQGRSVSFDGRVSEGMEGGDAMRGTWSAGNSPVGGPTGPGAQGRLSSHLKQSGLSNTSINKKRAERTDSSGTGSTFVTKYSSSNSSVEVKVGTVPKERHSTGPSQVIEEGKKKGKGGKDKKAKGPKEFAGAFAKFWVG